MRDAASVIANIANPKVARDGRPVASWRRRPS